ncbi:MAG: YgfZ/GcvT domain-containing protein [Pseudomonadota bacterium]
MNQAWQAFLYDRGARRDGGRITDFGSPAEELAAASSGTVLVPLSAYGVIRASGEDAASFLHNLLTNDIKKLGASAAQHNSLCSAKGRMLANFLVWRDEGDYLLQLSADLQPAVHKKLSMYVLRSKVKLSDAGDGLVLLGIAGAAAEAAVKEATAVVPEGVMAVARFLRGQVIRLGERRFELAVTADAAPEVWQRLAARARPAGFPVWQWLDIQAGWPLITAATQEQFVPQMANFELIGGVSFQKGCYPGQEIVARTQYLGKLKRRMYLAHLAEGAAPGSELFSPDLPDQACGMVVNSAPAPEGGSDVLAVMQMSSAEGGDVRLGSQDGPRLVLRPLPYAVS